MRSLLATIAAIVLLLPFEAGATTYTNPTTGQQSPGEVCESSPGVPGCGAAGTTTKVSGNVGGYDFFVSTTPTIQNASYVSGNCMGGFQAIAVGATNGASGILTKLTLISKGALVTAKQIYVFTSNPSASTCTDKSTFTIDATDLPKLITSFSVTPAVPTGGAASVGEASNLVDNYVTATNNDLYIAIVETTTETPASTTDLVLNIGGVKDAP